MNNPDLFRRANQMSHMVRVNFLKEFQPKIQWRPDGKDSLLDIGCAGGDITTENVQSIMPKTFSRLVGVDINENMIKYANETFGNSKISFVKLDIGGDFSKFLEENEPFDHITTLNCLHLVPDQKLAIENISKLLRPNGDCLLYNIIESANFFVYKKMLSQWSECMEDADDYVSFFFQRINPEYMLKKLLKNAGFSEHRTIVELRQHTFMYENIKELEDACKAIIPFYSQIPVEKQDEFMKQFMHHAMEFISMEEVSKDKEPEPKVAVKKQSMIVVTQSF